MNSTVSASILAFLIVILLSTVFNSILIMVGGKNIFKKAAKNEKTAMYPILNLFTMLEITDLSTFLGILFFLPVANIIVISIMYYKLGKNFNASTGYKIGLVIFPLCFYPLLAFSNKQYKVSDEEYFKALDNAKGESINLMTEEEIKEENNAVVDEGPKVDSIFKSELEQMEEVSPYKAAKVDLLGMEKLKQSTPEENIFAPIEEVAPPEQIKEESEEQKPQSKFTTELDKAEEVEYIDL